jgi:pyruvate dehydrogenase E1 component beta subunit
MSRITYREAIRLAHQKALSDPRVFLMGEDVGRYGGVYAVSKGLQQEFGEDRVRDAPLSESGFVGAGIGAALGGMRPIVEIMSVNFSLLALDQIVNNAATISHMSGGQFSVPIVIRMATGAGPQLAAQHSHSFEGWYAHVPGLKVLTPATVQDAHDMLLSALKEPDPVIIFEHVMLYGTDGDFTENEVLTSPYRALVRRAGKDVSLVTYGGNLPKVWKAAEELEGLGISAEIVDLRSLRPLDMPTILESVRKTHRVIVVDEAWKTGSFAGEVVARISEEAFFELDAPPIRICAIEVPIPYSKHLEEAALPRVSQIVVAARKVVNRA